MGMDERRHLWMVLTAEDLDGNVVVANLTKHELPKRGCSPACVVVRPGDHPWLKRDSCIANQRASLTSMVWLRKGVENGTYSMHAPLEPQLLARFREGVCASLLTSPAVKAALKQDGQSAPK